MASSKSSFLNQMKSTQVKNLETNLSVTENGAIGYKNTKSALVDMNFRVSSYRSLDEESILKDWHQVWSEDPILAVKYLFYARDIRSGLGERRLFRVIMSDLAKYHHKIAVKVLDLIGEFGRFDDVTELLKVKGMYTPVIKLIKSQLISDKNNLNAGKSISLLAKWLPSVNSKNQPTRKKALEIVKGLKWSERKYRKTLVELRRALEVVEVKMSANNWDKINYEHVPSKANLRYNNAFLKHDEDRRNQYIESVSKGEAKMNSKANYPYEVLHSYKIHEGINEFYENMWKNLPQLDGLSNTLVIHDGSGSMHSRISLGSSVMTIEVATALAIYCAEHIEGQFHNKCISFSDDPHIIDMSNCESLSEKAALLYRNSECYSTNIEAVFDLVLETAVENKLKQEEIPGAMLILSDMEFNSCCYVGSSRNWYGRSFNWESLFEGFSKKFQDKGYVLPKLVFWNICSRTMTIPMQDNDQGLILVSGFSPNVIHVMLNANDPYEALVNELNSDRYQIIEDRIKDIINQEDK